MMTRSTKIEIGALFGITVLSSLLLFMLGITLGHDIRFHLLRIAGIADELKAGHFPVRLQNIWMDGYGYPVSIYYGDFLLYFPALLHLLGVKLTRAYEIYLFFVNVATAIVSYICFKKIFKSQKIGLVLSLVYTTAPYRLVDIFVRSAVGEYTAFLFFPIIALAFYRIYFSDAERTAIFKSALLLSIGMSGLILTHILSTEMTIFVLLLLCACFARKTVSKNVLLSLSLAVFMTFLFCAFFIVPLIDYSLNVPVKVTQISEKHIQQGGVYFSQLFAFFQNPFGKESAKVKERMLFSPGMPLMAALVFSVIYLIYLKKDKPLVFLLIFSCFLLFLSSNRFPWNAFSATKIGRVLTQIQFAWRWLGFSLVALTLLLGRILKISSEGKRFRSCIVRGGVICMALLQTFSFTSNYLNNAENFSASSYTEFGSDQTMGREYIRLGTDKNNRPLEPYSENVFVTDFRRNRNSFDFHVSGIDEGFFDLPVFNYKGYKAFDSSGAELAISDGDNNVVRVTIPEFFDSDVSVRFVEPVYWRVSEAISAFSVLCALILILYRKKEVEK